ncbi:hypothetical protein FHS16_005583 [Paenibacillus endophyticus]|uniref:Uncharacterized protein n=1 Tax=Paenibacillus endophyticus TaxID=1294268 RepID=A0A7W5CDY9_9BACL|nr:ETEC_3214 domain-containing protein [Paenibacillus endophyticus]MBB3155475.1 hypothetical protein [Paenibacillus endophyticus]
MLLIKIYNFFQRKSEKSKQIFELVAALVTIGGWIIIAFTFGKDLLPGTELKAFSQKVSDLRLGQNYTFIEKKLGVPTVLEEIKYKTISAKEEQGSVATYYSNDYIVLTYFDNNKSLFGYTVISDSKYFIPKIPGTINMAKDEQQRLKNLPFKKVTPFNHIFKDWEPSLTHQYILARSGLDMARYYVEVYSMLNDGYLGVAVTDINRESKSMDKVFKGLSEITNPEASNMFYQQYSDYFDFVYFQMSFSEKADEVQGEIYEITQIDNEEINSYFLFSKISEVNTDDFLKKNLEHDYFISKQKMIQLK